MFLLLGASFRVCGSYADMHAGFPSEACKDFTGGVNQTYNLTEMNSAGHGDLWLILNRATRCQSLICCWTYHEEVKNRQTKNPQQKSITIDKKKKQPLFCLFQGALVSDTGLVNGHAYSITGVTKVNQGARNLHSA